MSEIRGLRPRASSLNSPFFHKLLQRIYLSFESSNFALHGALVLDQWQLLGMLYQSPFERLQGFEDTPTPICGKLPFKLSGKFRIGKALQSGNSTAPCSLHATAKGL
jgi:hypothetical protein